MPLPALRNLDAAPVQHEGQTLICLRDPEGITEDQAVLSPLAYFIASNLDGKTEIIDIQRAFANYSGGVLLMSEDILKVIEFLDENGFLLSERFLALHKKARDAFARCETRAAYGAGKSYPADPGELRAFLSQYFNGDSVDPGGHAAPVRCLIAPHIDFSRGGRTYAQAYERLRQCGKPEVAFIFGVAHAGGPVPFILTRKHFETPLGLLKTDRAIVDRLAVHCAWDPYEHELLHRTEHSIELQAVLLAHCCGPEVRIVPILCGQFSLDPVPPHPDSLEPVSAFLAECRAIIGGTRDAVAVIAGADLAHVGRRFGDAFDISATIVRQVEARDREDLAHVIAADADAFYQSVMKDENRRRVCGLACIYSVLKAVEGHVQQGEILDYHYAPDPAGGIVSFAGIVFPALPAKRRKRKTS